mgnify:CR=1 FL=1
MTCNIVSELVGSLGAQSLDHEGCPKLIDSLGCLCAVIKSVTNCSKFCCQIWGIIFKIVLNWNVNFQTPTFQHRKVWGCMRWLRSHIIYNQIFFVPPDMLITNANILAKIENKLMQAECQTHKIVVLPNILLFQMWTRCHLSHHLVRKLFAKAQWWVIMLFFMMGASILKSWIEWQQCFHQKWRWLFCWIQWALHRKLQRFWLMEQLQWVLEQNQWWIWKTETCIKTFDWFCCSVVSFSTWMTLLGALQTRTHLFCSNEGTPLSGILELTTVTNNCEGILVAPDNVCCKHKTVFEIERLHVDLTHWGVIAKNHAWWI